MAPISLDKYSVNNGNQIEYRYDCLGNRISKAVNNKEYRYIIESGNVIGELDHQGNNLVSYTYGNGIISQYSDGQTFYYILDGQGNIRYLIDEKGEVVNTYQYDGFGNILESTEKQENEMLYNSQQYDPDIELYYLRNRFLDTDTGRFISRDSYEGNIRNPITLNKYTYANDNPINYCDPNGLSATLIDPNGWREPIITGVMAHIYIEGKYAVDHEGHNINVIKDGGHIADRVACIIRNVPGRIIGGYPDIIDSNTMEIYEIKSRNEEEKGVRQIDDYLTGLSITGDYYLNGIKTNGKSYHPGTTWPAVARVAPWPLGGVLVYYLMISRNFE